MPTTGDDGTFEYAQRLKVELAARLFGESILAAAADGEKTSYLEAIPPGSNIVGFGFGSKWTGTSIVSEDAVRVYVRAKLPRRDVSSNEEVPSEINGVPTDVIPVGEITAAFPRPVPCGVSGGHHLITAGTLGCLVDRNGSGRFILSNNHVLANVNAAASGDAILEPGRADGGSVNPPIARLTAFKPLLLNGGVNEIDAAIAALIDPASMTPDIKSIGRVTPATLAPVKGMSVRKHGRTTAHTMGLIDDLAADVTVSYPGFGKAHFERQIAVLGVTGAFGAGGDSGSLVVDTLQTRPVGLLFAVSSTLTFCNYADKVLREFGSTVL